VSDTGGQPRPLTQVVQEWKETLHAGPVFLPDGRGPRCSREQIRQSHRHDDASRFDDDALGCDDDALGFEADASTCIVDALSFGRDAGCLNPEALS
jgi:hypothetical protein